MIPTPVLDMITDPDPARSERAFAAMLKMKKLDLAAMARAHAGNRDACRLRAARREARPTGGRPVTQALSPDAAVLDNVFRALSDATRRGVVERLVHGPASVSELAQPFAMSLPGFMKHLQVLEDAGLLVRAKEGRTVRCELAPQALGEAALWLAEHEKFWTAQLDALGRYLVHQEEVEPAWTPTQTTPGRSSASAAATPSPRRRSGGRGPTRRR